MTVFYIAAASLSLAATPVSENGGTTISPRLVRIEEALDALSAKINALNVLDAGAGEVREEVSPKSCGGVRIDENVICGEGLVCKMCVNDKDLSVTNCVEHTGNKNAGILLPFCVNP